jgi:hypothetical protein
LAALRGGLEISRFPASTCGNKQGRHAGTLAALPGGLGFRRGAIPQITVNDGTAVSNTVTRTVNVA